MSTGYCTRHDRLYREHGDAEWKSLPKKYPAEYLVWAAAKNRCTNPRNVQYHRYGGRGLVMCEHLSAFAGFIYEVGPRPADGLSLDRIANDKGYLCQACNGGMPQLRWATKEQQARNRRSSTGAGYAEELEVILARKGEAAAYPGVVYKPARRGKGAGVFEAYCAGTYLGRAGSAQEAAELVAS